MLTTLPISIQILIWTIGGLISLTLFAIPFWANGYLIPTTLIEYIKTWKPKLYEIPGYAHYITMQDGDWFPRIRFLVKYRRGYYILDKQDDEWVWKRPCMTGTLALDRDKKPTERLKLVVMTGLQWDREVKRVKKLKYKDLPIIHGIESAIWYPPGE